MQNKTQEIAQDKLFYIETKLIIPIIKCLYQVLFQNLIIGWYLLK